MYKSQCLNTDTTNSHPKLTLSFKEKTPVKNSYCSNQFLYNKLSGIDKKGEMLYDAFHSVLSMPIGFSSSYNKNASVRFTLTNQLSERH